MAAAAIPSPGPPLTWETAQLLLERWLQEVTDREVSHRNSAKKRRYPSWILGVLSTVLNSAVGVSFFTAWQQQLGTVSTDGKTWILAITFSAAICSALLTTLRLPERSDRHLNVANECHSIRIEIEYHLACPPVLTDLRGILEALKTRIAALGVDD
jgi:hypothetical protein